MATIDISVAASSADGYGREDLSQFDTTDTSHVIGRAANTPHNTFLLFSGVTIPQGETIVSAYIEFVNSTISGSPLTAILADDSDNPSAPTTASDLNGRTRTTAKVDYDPSGLTGGSTYQTPDIAAVIQEIVDRAGWASGNSILILWDDDGTATNTVYVRPASYDHATYAAPLLHVVYGGAFEGFGIPIGI